MVENTQLNILINVLKDLLNEYKIPNSVVNETIDFGDPVFVVSRPNGERIQLLAPGYFKVNYEIKTPRKLWFDKVEIDEVATLAIFQNGELDVYFKKPELKTTFENICNKYFEKTKFKANLFDSN